MSEHEHHNPRDAVPLPLEGEPRSQVWRWLLGGSSTVSTGLIVSLVTGLILATFGSSAISDVLGEAFQWPFWIVLLASLGLVGYRVLSGVRDRRRFDRELELTEGLIAPVAGGTKPAVRLGGKGPPTRPLSPHAAWLLRASDQIDLDEFDVDALLAMYAAMVSAPHRIPGRLPPASESLSQLLNELVSHGYLVPTAVNRLRRTELDQPARPGDQDGLDWQGSGWQAGLAAAVPALLQHHADLATRWAAALNTTKLAAGAAQWFIQNDEQLSQLVRTAREGRTAVVVELGRILDALEIWYARTGRPEATSELAGHIVVLTKERQAELPILASLARIRADAGDDPPAMKPRKFDVALRARAEHHTLLSDLADELAGEPTRESLEGIEDDLEKVWWKLSPEDVVGEVCALINLAIIHLEQGRLEAAQDRLELADSLTSKGRDPSGRAHAQEISGLVCWAQGTPRRAVAHWRRALSLYRDLQEDLGTTRCLRHLATAVRRAHELSGLVVVADPPLPVEAVLRYADAWIDYADRISDQGFRPQLERWPDRLEPYPAQGDPWQGWLRPFRR